ncbi:MAG: sugar phosphate nucleotidyltransferase [Eubacteriales bacterium]|nr:sugar phosphate nucleotidyltransferase [Eubacteriales bacterium]
MSKITLVVMAAGLGSRFGGMKQIAPVDDQGHIIMDFSIFDALRAGFDKVVCIIRPENEADFHEALGKKIARQANLEYAYQTLEMLPEGFSLPEGRKKPWGTAHAVLCAADHIPGAFAAINADDFYGRGAFDAIANFLRADGPENLHAMVGYNIENTLTENGYVSRGVCSTDAAGMLSGIVERTHIEKRPGGAAYIEDSVETFVPAGTVVSMNMWGFRHSILDAMRTQFVDFLQNDLPRNPEKAEFFLPSVPNRLIREGKAQVRMLNTTERWYGVTYAQDMPTVQSAIARMKAEGIYPERLWG